MEKIKNNGYGYGSGSGYGYGDGSGYGYGYGSGIKTFNNNDVYIVDGVQTLIYSVHENYAKGAILKDDLTLEQCFIARVEDCFAHGKTLRDAFNDVNSKAFEDKPIEERIEMFKNRFKKDVKYPAKDFYGWHHILTGSCEMGRKNFAANHGIDIDKDSFTVKEFIALTENDYNGEIIKQLKNSYI